MFDDPSYNELVILDTDLIYDAFTSSIFKDHKKPITCYKNPTTNQYKILISNEQFISYYYCLNEKLILHRENYPAIIKTFNGKIVREKYYEYGVPHRINGPQEITYYYDKPNEEYYRVNGILHRDDGPAHIIYTIKTDAIASLQYYTHGQTNRLDGPAYCTYNYLGKQIKEQWYKNDHLHRIDGPACIDFINGESANKEWWINGQRLNIRKFPRFEDGKLCGRIKLTPNSIIKAMMFDRDYGTFLKEMYDKMSSSK